MDKININTIGQKQPVFKSEIKVEKKYDDEFTELLYHGMEQVGVFFDKELSKGQFYKNAGIMIDIPNHPNNEALLYIKKDEKEPELKRFVVSVKNKHRDRLFSKNLFKGTDKEIKEYIKDENNLEEIKNTILELSKKTDDFYSSI